MGIEQKSIATLFDEFCTNQIRCWTAQDKIDQATTVEEKAAAGDLAQQTNIRRNQLMRAIDDYFNDPNAQLSKSYDHDVQVNLDAQVDDLLEQRLMDLEKDVRTLCDFVLHPTDTEKTRHFAEVLLKTVGEAQ